MAYAPGYWAELVRSSSSTTLTESTTGTFVWLRTSDGNPLEQEFDSGGFGTWFVVGQDADEPDYLGLGVTAATRFRFRKSGEAWLPDDNGIQINTVPWAGASTYRFFENVSAPAKPTGFSVTASGQAFRLQASVDNGGSAITKWQYKIAATSAGLSSASWTDISSTSDDLDFTTGNIGYSTTRHFQVRAVNAEGNGAASDADSATTGAAPVTNVAPSFSPSSGAAQSWTAGTAITNITVPAATGTPSPTYSATGLPAGVSFNDSTRVISGTPTTAGTGTITVTATNSEGTDTYTIAWTVAAATTPTVSVSVAVDDATPTNGDTVTFTATVGGTATGSIAYQWQQLSGSSWGNISGETGSTYDHTRSSAGTVTVRCRATREGVTATSAQASATWSAAPPPDPVVTTDTDSIYILGTTAPGTPAGGTNAENHLPSGWSRTEPDPTATENVYRSQRTRTFTDGAFTSATAWGAPAKIADASPLPTAPLQISLAAARYVGRTARASAPGWYNVNLSDAIPANWAAGSSALDISRVAITRSGSSYRLQLLLSGRLNSDAEGGTVTLAFGSTSVTLDMAAGLSSGLYTIATTAAVYNAMAAGNSGQAGTLTFALDSHDAEAPTLAITDRSTVAEGGTLNFTATPSGGKYDDISYAWSVVSGGGTISGSGASATYTAPQVSSDTAVRIRCVATVEGDGTNATPGTSDTVTADETFTVTDTTVTPPPTPTVSAVASGPTSRASGQAATYTVSVGGTATGTITYQWQWRQGTSGAWTDTDTTASLTEPGFNGQTFQYRVVVTRQGVSATSNIITTVWAAAPTDTTAPTVSTRTVNGASLVITCSEALDTNSVPAASAFAVVVAGAARTVSAVSIAGSAITLTLASAVTAGQTVTVAYTKPSSNPVQDAAGNDLATFAAATVTNNTPAQNSDTLTLIAAALRNRNGPEWDYYSRVDDPALDASLTPGNTTRVLSRCRLFRGGGALTATTSRQFILDFEGSATQSRGTGDDLTAQFEQHGSVVLTLADGKTLNLGSPASAGDVTDHYAWTVDADETEFDYAEFDAAYDALVASISAGTPLSATLLVRDFTPPEPPDEHRIVGVGAATFRAPAAATLSVTQPAPARHFAGIGSAAFQAPSAAVLTRSVPVRFSGRGEATFRDPGGAILTVAGVLPYELALTGSGVSLVVQGQDFGSGDWNAVLPADRWIGNTPTTIGLILRGSAQTTPGAYISVGPDVRTRRNLAGGQDLIPALEEARIKIQSSDGATTYWEGLLDDRTEAYNLGWTSSEVTAFLEGLHTSLKLRFEEASILFAGVGEATFRTPAAATLARTAPTAVRFAGSGSAAFRAATPAVLTRTAPTARRIVGTGSAAFRAPAAAVLTKTAPTAITFSGRGSATFRPPVAAALTHVRVAAIEVAGTGEATFRAPGAATLTRTAPAAITFAGQGSAAFRTAAAAILSRIEAQRIAGRGAAAFRPASAAVLTRTAPTAVRFAGQGSATFQTPGAATLDRITGSREFTFRISAVSTNANGFTTIGSTAGTDDQRVIPFILAGGDADLDYLQIRWHGNRADRRQIRIVFAGTNPGRFSRDVERTAPLIFVGGPFMLPLATWRGPDLADYWDAANNRYVIDIRDDDDFQSANGGQELNAAIRALGVGVEVRFSIGKTTLFSGVGAAEFRAPAAAVLSRSVPVRFSGVGSATTFQAPAAATLTRTAPTARRIVGTGTAGFRAAAAAALTRTAPSARRFAGRGAAAFRAPSAAALTLTAPTARRITGSGAASFRVAAAAALSRSRPTGIGFAGLGSASFRAPAAAALSRTRPTGIAFTGLGSTTFRAPAAASLTVQHPILVSGLGSAAFRTPATIDLTVVPRSHDRIWPADLPTEALARGFSQTYLDNVARSPVERGPPRRRGRYTRAVRRMQFIMPMTRAQWAALMTFYEETMDGGRLSVFMPDPLTAGLEFLHAEFLAAPSRVRRGARWDVTFRIRSLEN